MTTYKNLEVNYLENGIVKVYFSREKQLNALNTDLLKELDSLLDELNKKEDIKALIFTGKGKAFVAGADISEMKDLGSSEAKNFAKLGQDVFEKIEKFKVPTIALVNGFALGGGCEIAMATDIILSSNKAKFGQPEVTLGIIPGFSGTSRLAKRVGISVAKEIIFTGDIIDSNRAKEIGLVNHVFEPDALDDEGLNLVNKIIKNSIYALSNSKKSIDLSYNKDIGEANEIEREHFSDLFSNGEAKEGMSAFLEKRKPNFK